MALRVVVMGVAGSGKTAIGRRLAGRLGAQFVEADELHPPENIAKMSAGIPLDDADRWPWLDRIVVELAAAEKVVATCSALKRSYRDVLRRAGDVVFVHLDVDRATVEGRVASRRRHFMGPEMVASQFATLEPIGADETDVISLTETGSLGSTVSAALDAIRSLVDGA
jgi:gluconokinase